MSASMLKSWIRAQKPQATNLNSTSNSPFHRNLEETLDTRRRTLSLYTIKTSLWRSSGAIDFSSNDTLSLSSSGILRRALDAELAANPGLPPGASGSRIMDGNSEYLELVEEEIAKFHGAETGLFVASGFEANLAIFAAIPRAGDVIVYDELVHASTHDGMERSAAKICLPFRHNDPEALREVLLGIMEKEALVRQEKRCVLIALEAVYSMDGDICPLAEMVAVAKEVFPGGNAQFVVDEAHSTGVIGADGRGLVSVLGLEREVAIRLHTFGKAVGAAGAIILGSSTVKTALTNLARCVIYTTAPATPLVATVRAAYDIMRTGQTRDAQYKVHHLVKYFFRTINSHPIWDESTDRGIISVPLAEDWEKKPFQSHIVPIWTRDEHSFWLVFHLNFAGYCTFPVVYPTVPKGQSRVRLAFHADNTEEHIDGLINSVCKWAEEMMGIEDGVPGCDKIPSAAKRVYAAMGNEETESARL